MGTDKPWPIEADEAYTRSAEAFLATDPDVLAAYRQGLMPLPNACELASERTRADRLGLRRPSISWAWPAGPFGDGTPVNRSRWRTRTWAQWSAEQKDHGSVLASRARGEEEWHKHRTYLNVLASRPMTDDEREALERASQMKGSEPQSGAYPRRESWQQYTSAMGQGDRDGGRSGGYCFRSMQQDLALEPDGRTLVGMLAPYNEVARVDDGRGPYWEAFEPGCFDQCLRRKPSVLKVKLEHRGHWVGRGHMWRDGPKGLAAEMRLDDTEAGREAAFKVRDGQAPGLSLAFYLAGADSTTMTHRDGRQVVHRKMVKAIDHVALCQQGAYPSAQVTAVRAS
jgi:HK97 family phage prohead protease